MNDTTPDQNHSGHYYNYRKRKPLLRRLVSSNIVWPIYCDRCNEPVPWERIVFGIDVAQGALKSSFSDHEVCQMIRNHDWSMIASASPIHWKRGPVLLVHLASCGGCNGPFSVVGKVQGVVENTMYLGGIFLGELSHERALDLLEIALESDLYINDSYRNQAIAACKALGSAIDFEALHTNRTERLVGMESGLRAMQAHSAGRHEEALEGLLEAIDVFRRTGQGRLEANSWQNIGLVHYQRKAFGEARAAFDKAISIASAHNDPQTAASSHLLLADIHRECGDLDAAEAAFRSTLSLDQGLPGTMFAAATASLELADLLIRQQRNDEARGHLAQALELSRQLGASDEIARAEASLQRLNDALLCISLPPFRLLLPRGFTDIITPAQQREYVSPLPSNAYAKYAWKQGSTGDHHFHITNIASPGPLTEALAIEIFRNVDQEAPRQATSPQFLKLELTTLRGVTWAIRDVRLDTRYGNFHSREYLVPSGIWLAMIQIQVPLDDWEEIAESIDTSVRLTEGIRENTGSMFQYRAWQFGRRLGRPFL